jgi:hypothetical protein
MGSLLTRSLKPQANRIASGAIAPTISAKSAVPSGGDREFSGYFYRVSIDAWRSTQLIEAGSHQHKPNLAFAEPLLHCLRADDSPSQRARTWGDTDFSISSDIIAGGGWCVLHGADGLAASTIIALRSAVPEDRELVRLASRYANLSDYPTRPLVITVQHMPNAQLPQKVRDARLVIAALLLGGHV